MSTSSRRPRSSRHVEPPAVTLADLPEARAFYAQLDPSWFDEANDPEAWLFEPEVQQIIAEVIDAELLPFASLLGPDELRVLREEIEIACHTDPVTIEYLNRIRPRPDQESSGEQRKGTRARGPAVVALPGKKAGGERP